MTMREFKSFPAEFKADGEEGRFRAVVSVFGNVDRGGDRMVKGAFARTLKERGLPPVYWNHAWTLGPIGHTISAEETDKGLEIEGQFDLESGDPLVKRIHNGMRNGSVKEFSFAFETRDSKSVTEDGEEVRELTDVELFEVGPVTVGMNPETELLEVASAYSTSNPHGTVTVTFTSVASPGTDSKESSQEASQETDSKDGNDGQGEADELRAARIKELLLAYPTH